jgi:hypothetical protein
MTLKLAKITQRNIGSSKIINANKTLRIIQEGGEYRFLKDMQRNTFLRENSNQRFITKLKSKKRPFRVIRSYKRKSIKSSWNHSHMYY